MIRRLIVFDGENWYVRRVAVIEHDLTNDHMVYHCDKPLGGPFKTAQLAIDSFTKKNKSSIKKHEQR